MAASQKQAPKEAARWSCLPPLRSSGPYGRSSSSLVLARSYPMLHGYVVGITFHLGQALRAKVRQVQTPSLALWLSFRCRGSIAFGAFVIGCLKLAAAACQEQTLASKGKPDNCHRRKSGLCICSEAAMSFVLNQARDEP